MSLSVQPTAKFEFGRLNSPEDAVLPPISSTTDTPGAWPSCCIGAVSRTDLHTCVKCRVIGSTATQARQPLPHVYWNSDSELGSSGAEMPLTCCLQTRPSYQSCSQRVTSSARVPRRRTAAILPCPVPAMQLPCLTVLSALANSTFAVDKLFLGIPCCITIVS